MDQQVSGPGDFAVRLRALRQAAALTQEELAERAGLTAKAIGALERGERRRPYPHTVRALADALGLGDDARAALSRAARSAPAAAPGEGAASRQLQSSDEPQPGHQPAQPPAPAQMPAPVLPRPTPLAGRERELTGVLDLIRSGRSRLVTLTGPGGVGKTRLAAEVLSQLTVDFGLSVALAELASLRRPGLVPGTIAQVVGLFQPGVTGQQEKLVAFIGPRRFLLVLDNLEHLLADGDELATLVAGLLAGCPNLVVLATSRAPLRIRAEQEYPLAPLGLPRDDSPDAVTASAAGRMFLDRAAAVQPGLECTPQTAPAIASICRRLDGLPLAIELAAAHARFLPPAQLLARLDQQLDRPRGGRDLPERQRTVRATLDWSNTLLTGTEQLALQRFSVFAGGATLAAAEAVVADDDVPDVLAAVEGLTEQSLLIAGSAGGEPRFRMLEPIRQYAAAKLGPGQAIHDRHSAWTTGFADRLRLGVAGPEQAQWIVRGEAEQGNLRVALEHEIGRGAGGSAAAIAWSSWLFWALRGRAAEGLGWTGRILALPGLPPPSRVRALVAAAGLCYATGDIPGLLSTAEPAAAGARAAGDEWLLAEALVLLASGQIFSGTLGPAGDHLRLAVEQAEASDHTWAVVHALAAQGQLLQQAGDLAASSAVLAGAETLARGSTGPFTVATVLNIRATVDQQLGDDAAARARLVEAAGLSASVGTLWTLVYALPQLAAIAATADQPEIAVRLFAAGAAMTEASALVVTYPPSIELVAGKLAQAREVLGESRFQQAWASGRALDAAGAAGLAAQL